jgi:hypothetical protein
MMLAMSRYFLSADETGNLDYDSAKNPTESEFFGFGTALLPDQHGEALWSGLELRTRLSKRGMHLPKGFHAKDDSTATRSDVFEVIGELAPRFDTTFLRKQNAFASVRDKGEMHLYKLAWYLHFKEVAKYVANKNDTIVVIAGTFGTAKRASQARAALDEVCTQINRTIELCVWESSSSWGLQVADYGLWSTQRHLQGKGGNWHETYVAPNLATCFLPWK